MTQRHLLVPTAVAAAAMLLLPATARGGGFEYGTDNGAGSVARGGASTALGGALHGLYTNVAAAADTPGRADIYLSGNLTFRHLWYEGLRLDDPDTPLDAVHDENPLFAGPMLGASIRVWRYLTLIVGANGPAAVGWGHYPHGDAANPGPTRYDLTDMDVLFLWPAIGLGFTVPGLEELRFGFTFQPAFLHVKFTSYANAFAAGNADLDILTVLDVFDPFVPAGQIGVLYRVWNIEMGAQVRLSDSVLAEGTLTPTESPYDDGGIEQPAARASLEMGWPLAVVRFGIRYFYPREGHEGELLPHRRELFDVEADFVYEQNSAIEDFHVIVDEPLQMSTGELILPPVDIAHRWNDSFAARLGGSVNLLNGDLTLSLGGFFESPTVPNAYTRLDFAGWMRFGVGAGATYRIRWFDISLAYQHIFMPDRTVSLEEARAYPLRGNAVGGVFDDYPINAGDYRGGYDILAVSLGARI